MRSFMNYLFFADSQASDPQEVMKSSRFFPSLLAGIFTDLLEFLFKSTVKSCSSSPLTSTKQDCMRWVQGKRIEIFWLVLRGTNPDAREYQPTLAMTVSPTG